MILQKELVEADPSGWKMLVGCICLNQTTRTQVDRVLPHLFDDYRNSSAMADAEALHLCGHIKPLGLQHRRGLLLIRFSQWWRKAGGHQGHVELGQWVERDPAFGDRIVGMEPPGVGDYARDSWVIFMEGRVPEWDVHDKVLLKYLQEG